MTEKHASDTPLTDEAERDTPQGDHTRAAFDFARRMERDRVRLLEALREAVAAVKVFHGPVAWDIYEENAPEMKRWKALLRELGEGEAA